MYIPGPKPDPAPSKLDVAPLKPDPVPSEPDSGMYICT